MARLQYYAYEEGEHNPYAQANFLAAAKIRFLLTTIRPSDLITQDERDVMYGAYKERATGKKSFIDIRRLDPKTVSELLAEDIYDWIIDF